MNNVILIGMPGCGKSTLGVLLAKMLGLSFVDTDIVIQEKTGKKLYEIIDKQGKEEFLKLEEEINLCLKLKNTVIATGGSAVYSAKAMEHYKRIGKIVFLDISYETLVNRLGDFSRRGVIIKNGGTLKEMYNERLPLYKKYADVTVNGNIEEIAVLAKQLEKIL